MIFTETTTYQAPHAASVLSLTLWGLQLVVVAPCLASSYPLKAFVKRSAGTESESILRSAMMEIQRMETAVTLLARLSQASSVQEEAPLPRILALWLALSPLNQQQYLRTTFSQSPLTRRPSSQVDLLKDLEFALQNVEIIKNGELLFNVQFDSGNSNISGLLRSFSLQLTPLASIP